jgi:hypothetical protein
MSRIVLDRPYDGDSIFLHPLVELRRCLKIMGCDTDALVIEHPGDNFVVLGMTFVHRGPSPFERWLDQEIGA